MTAATITELSVEQFPVDVKSGTKTRRARVFFRGPTGTGGKTIAIASYVPGAGDVEGIYYETDTDAKTSSASTWSTTTVTVAAGIATYEACYGITFL